jgi:tetratricopeptide (TPR) repeat protein
VLNLQGPARRTEAVISVDKEKAKELVLLGNERREAGDNHNAREMYRGAIHFDEANADAYDNLATLALAPGRFAAAIALRRRAIAIDPLNGARWSNYGNTLWRAQHFEEAEQALLRAIEIKAPGFAPFWNIGILYYSMGRGEDAMRYLEKALALAPDNYGVQSDYAHAVLMSGDLARGLELIEVRWPGNLLKKNLVWDCDVPQWNGAPLRTMGDGTLLLHHEQGFGDTLQFCRFIPHIKPECDGRIVFACPKALHRLLTGQLEIDELIDSDDPGALVRAALKADAHSPLISAVAKLRPSYDTMPPPEPYLKTPVIRSDDLHSGGAKLAIGLCWGAALTTERGPQKSCGVEDMLVLGEIPGIKLWSLQFGPYEDSLARTAADHLVTSVPGGLGDFAETAAIINRLDLVVTIDTATAHLAGALGKPVFMLNPLAPCWRWVYGAKPWYSTMKIFNQTDPDNWVDPMDEIVEELQTLEAQPC